MFTSWFPTVTSSLSKRLLFLYLLGYGATVFFSLGAHQPDEHFQILEFAGWKAGVPSSLLWEFPARIRPSLQPTLVYLLYRIGEWVYGSGNVDPFALTTLLRFLTLLMYTVASLFFLEALLRNLTPQNRVRVLWWSILIWFLPYVAVRFSSENLSRIFFLLSLSLPLWWEGREKKTLFSWIWFLAGMASGLAFYTRFQVALMTIGFFLWLLIIKRESIKNLSWFVVGVLSVCVGNILLDIWFYGEWVLTPWNYFQVNILEGKVNTFGIHPWYDYFSQITAYNIPFFPLYTLLPLVFLITQWRHVLTWVTLPFLLVHFYIGHKELRFLFPLISFLPFFIVIAGERWWSLGERYGRIRVLLKRYFLITNALLLLVAIFRPADFNVAFFYRHLYQYRGDPIYFFNHPSDPYPTPQRVGLQTWYLRGTRFVDSITNTDHLWTSLEAEDPPRSGSVVLVTPTPLLLGKEFPVLSPEWTGDHPFPLPQWEYSFPFRGIEELPSLYHFWTKVAVLRVFHVYIWEPPGDALEL